MWAVSHSPFRPPFFFRFLLSLSLSCPIFFCLFTSSLTVWRQCGVSALSSIDACKRRTICCLRRFGAYHTTLNAQPAKRSVSPIFSRHPIQEKPNNILQAHTLPGLLQCPKGGGGEGEQTGIDVKVWYTKAERFENGRDGCRTCMRPCALGLSNQGEKANSRFSSSFGIQLWGRTEPISGRVRGWYFLSWTKA